MSAFKSRTRVHLDSYLPSIYVNVEGDGRQGLGQYAGRVAHAWARENGYQITERLYTNVSAQEGFATGVESRYRVRNVRTGRYAVRLRHDSGTVTLVTAATDAATAVHVVLTAEGAPARSVVWVAEQPVCDYCDRPATRRVRESREPVCAACARALTDGPVREYVSTLPATQWTRVSVS